MWVNIVKGDITDFDVEVIVNAANSSLLGGGGVDGAIHRKAGTDLLVECKKIRKEKYLAGLPTGQVVLTKGYNLPAKNIIHTVGPIYGEEDILLLKNCYRNALILSEEKGFRRIAFPCISTGVYGVPKQEAAQLVKEVIDEFDFERVEEVHFVMFDDENYNIYKKIFN